MTAHLLAFEWVQNDARHFDYDQFYGISILQFRNFAWATQ